MSSSAGSTTADVIGSQISNIQGKQRLQTKNRKRKGTNMKDETKKKMIALISEALEKDRRWQDFIDKSSSSVIASDKKLKKLIDTYKKQQKETLEKAVSVVKKRFKVPNMEYDIKEKFHEDLESGLPYMDLKFIPKGKNKNGKSLNFQGIRVAFDEATKPAIYPDEDANEFFAQHINDDLASAIKGSLLNIQDKYLVKLDKVAKTLEDINVHMDGVEHGLSKLLSSLPDLDTRVLKKLIRSKYNGQ